MRKTILYLSGFMIISSLSVSCVSKKKFEELARAKREVDRNLLDLKRDKKQLEDQLQLAKDDFNTIRYKLTENNAVKDKTIDQLYTKLRSLESKQVELKSELSNVADQIKTTTQSTSEQISSLESSLKYKPIWNLRIRKSKHSWKVLPITCKLKTEKLKN